MDIFGGEACINGLYVLTASGQFFFCKVLLECCLLVCPSRKSHTWANRGALHQAGPAACAMEVYAAFTVLDKGWKGFCWLICTGKSSLLGMDWINLKEEFWQQPFLKRQLKLICHVLTVFSQQSWTQVVHVRNLHVEVTYYIGRVCWAVGEESHWFT